MRERTIIILAIIAALTVLGSVWLLAGSRDVAVGTFSNATSTTQSNQNIEGGLTVARPSFFTASLRTTGTSSVEQSDDGLIVGGTFSTAATGTLRTIYTNTTGPKYCDADTAFAYWNATGVFAPSIVFSMGTSTGSVSSRNLVASSTVATTTDTLLQPATGTRFILGSGDQLNAIFADGEGAGNTEASTTYFSRWTAEVGMWCTDLSI